MPKGRGSRADSMSLSRRLWLLGALALVTLMVSIGVSAQDEKVIVIGHAESTDSLDPAHGYTGTTNMIIRATYDTLVTFPDADASSIEAMLATDWAISDDGLTYTFTLREDGVFSDGTPITAADVVFSIKRLQNIKGNPSFLADNIADVVADGDYTVTFTLKAIRPSFLSELTNYSFSVTNSKAIIANGGTDAADAATTDTAQTFLDGTSAGSGPYVLESWELQVQTVLVKNPNYSGVREAYFDRVIIQNIVESATQKIALESGEIDIALEVTSDQVAEMAGNADIAVYKNAGLQVHFVLMNADPEIGGPVADTKVAKAIRLALDYEGYLDLWGGVTPGSNLAVGLAGAYSNVSGNAVTRNLDEAKALLAEAGYADGFTIDLNYPDFTWQGVNMNTNAQKIQSDLAEVGITVNLVPAEIQVALEGYRSGTQGFAYWFWGPDILDPLDMLSFLPGGKVASERAKWMAENADPALLELIEQAKVETDAAARDEIFAQLQDIAQESGAFAPFVQPDLTAATRADIEGYVWHPQWTLDVSLLKRAE